jgi:hypothetical protein
MLGEDWQFYHEGRRKDILKNRIEDIMNEAVIFPLKWVFDS